MVKGCLESSWKPFKGLKDFITHPIFYHCYSFLNYQKIDFTLQSGQKFLKQNFPHTDKIHYINIYLMLWKIVSAVTIQSSVIKTTKAK